MDPPELNLQDTHCSPHKRQTVNLYLMMFSGVGSCRFWEGAFRYCLHPIVEPGKISLVLCLYPLPLFAPIHQVLHYHTHTHWHVDVVQFRYGISISIADTHRYELTKGQGISARPQMCMAGGGG